MDKRILIILIIAFILVFPSCRAENTVKTKAVGETSKEKAEEAAVTVKEENIMETKTEDKIEEVFIQDITVKEVNSLVENDNYFLIDVRTEEEYESGHIKGSVNIPVDSLESKLGKVARDKKIIVYCKLGSRSRRAAKILVDNGFKEVYNMVGGIEEWKEEDFLLEN